MAKMSNPSKQRLFYWLAIGAAILVLAVLFVESRVPVGYDVAVAAGPYLVRGKDVVSVAAAPIVGGQVDVTQRVELPIDTAATADGKNERRVRLPEPGEIAVQVTARDKTVTYQNVHVASAHYLALAAALLVLIAILLPKALGDASAEPGGGAWYQLLSEPEGGFSLARVQLLVWFLPAATLYGALSFTLQNFVALTPQITALLGLSGATTLLGTAASPSPATSSPASRASTAVTPDLRDMVSDWRSSHGDLSRYQYLLLSVVGAVVMVAAFWRQRAMPEIPSQFLYLVAASQATYLATKAVKANDKPDEDGATPPPASRAAPAPARVSAARPGSAGLEGSFTPSTGASKS